MIILARSIGKLHAVNSLAYVIKEEKDHVLLASDGIDHTSLTTMMDDFSLYQKDRVKKPFITTVISPAIEDNLDLEGLRTLLLEVQKELGLTNRQYYAVIHQNTDNPHIHLISNRIDYDNKTWEDKHVAWKCQTACLNICNKLNLTSAFDKKGKYQGLGEAKNNEFLQDHLIKAKKIQSYFHEVKYKAKSIHEVFIHLQSKGVVVNPLLLKNGKIGIAFEYEGKTIKASKVDRLLTVIPDGEGFKANPHFQRIIDLNIDREAGRRTADHIHQEMINYPDRSQDCIAELTAFYAFLALASSSKKADYEEKKQEYERNMALKTFRPKPKFRL
jgi:hypothetical protein